MTPLDKTPQPRLQSTYLANRGKLVRFLIARGAGDDAEDLLQELWLKVTAGSDIGVLNPLSYLYRAAETLMIDRHRARSRAAMRDREWVEADLGVTPADGERTLGARQEIGRVAAVLAALGPRREAVFRRARLDGVPQRVIAAELGVSLSTVESDLRVACKALAELREKPL